MRRKHQLRPAAWVAMYAIGLAACAQALDFDGYQYQAGSQATTSSGGNPTAGGSSASTNNGGSGGSGGSGGMTSSSSGSGAGSGRSELGENCQENDDCKSDECTDGVCCDDRCGGTCESCLGADTNGSDGTCLPIPNGQDPDNECSGDCNGSGACVDCDMTPTAPGGTCPTACSSCSGNNNEVCNIVCTESQKCSTVTCPAGFDCNVTCTDSEACRNATITCGSHECSVTCTGTEACDGATINCGAGACHITCGSGNNVCNNTEVNCGPELCECSGGSSLHCGQSCGCMPC